MKHIYIVVLWLMWLAASPLQAQPRFTSHTERISFGQIAWKHPVAAEFSITNTGTEPLVLTQVEPDCACAVAEWTQTPIAAGEKGILRVTFDAEALGKFQKTILVYTNAQPHVVCLYIDGQVVEKVTDYTRSHPYLIGQIRLDRNVIDFSDAHIGEKPKVEIGIVNLSTQVYEPMLMHLPSYVNMNAEPEILQPGEAGIIRLSLDTDRLSSLGLTQTSVYLSRFMGDKVEEDNELPLSAILLPDFSRLSDEEIRQAPSIRLSAYQVDLLSALEKKKRVHADVIITNEGKSALSICKVQTFSPSVGIHLKNSIVQPGASTRLRVILTRRNMRKHNQCLRMLLITNDPVQPKVQIDIR